VRAARGLLGITQENLAKRSGISVPTIKRIELINGAISARIDTYEKLVEALESAGIEFIPENGGGIGVRLRKPK